MGLSSFESMGVHEAKLGQIPRKAGLFGFHLKAATSGVGGDNAGAVGVEKVVEPLHPDDLRLAKFGS